MSVPSPPESLVLLALRLTGLAEPQDIADRTGLDLETVGDMIETAHRAGRVRYREGSFHGWALLAAGRERSSELLASELDAHELARPVGDIYERFRPVNADLLALCTAWQLRDVGGQPKVNEHDDPEYDARCVEALGELDDKAEPLVTDLALLLDRFGSYPGRLRAARQRVEEGGHAYFTSPGVDSYHTIWFELHEHLLATLGRERTDERNDA